MNLDQLLWQGVSLALYGMGTVFFFLILLILLIQLISKATQKFSTAQISATDISSSTSNSDKLLRMAITKAIEQYRIENH